MAVFTTAVPVLNQTKIKTNRKTNTKTKTLLRPLITICIGVYKRFVTASTTPSDKDKDKVNAVDKRPVKINLQNLQRKNGGRRQICKKKMTQMISNNKLQNLQQKKDGQYCNGKR